METESVVKNTRQRSTMLVYLALIGFALLLVSLSIAISVGAVAVCATGAEDHQASRAGGVPQGPGECDAAVHA